jgi:hypothetical protein
MNICFLCSSHTQRYMYSNRFTKDIVNQLRNGVVISSHVLHIDTKEALIAFPVTFQEKALVY